MVKWTKEQNDAIYTSGHDVLVAAAAGSGKTAVLVERIIQKLLNENDPVHIDQLLVATFTNAAAQEMRNRVSSALELALEENPESAHLKQQLTLIQQASISTLHSFCLDLVKRYSYLIDIDPGFRIADEIEADLLRQEVIDDLFEDWYGKPFDQQEAFFELIDRFSSDRSDQEVELLILKLYEFAMQNPSPDYWLDQIANQYNIPDNIDESELNWLLVLKQDVRDQLEQSLEDLEQALNLTRESDGPYHYAEAIDLDILLIQELKAKLEFGWDQAQQGFQQLSFKALSRKKIECNPDKRERVKVLRDRSKKRLTELAKQLFTRDLSAHLKDLRTLYPTVKQLVILVKDFGSRYRELKKDQGLVDFSDLEHYALQILRDPESRHDEIKPSSVAIELRNKYEEVLVDEYQDTNMVQETIIQLVSRDEPGNLFMVGDVKQSIYRFRHAEPSLFIEKYKQFSQPGSSGARIDLAKNFRSRKQVLEATNYIFRQVLDEEVGEINYDPDAELIYGNLSYDEASQEDVEAELVIIDREAQDTSDSETGDETFVDLAKAEIEARAYAKRIKQWIGIDGSEPRLVFDKDTGMSRPAQYRDIVILLRSMTWAPTIMEELKKQGIPVYAELTTGYLEAIEIQVMLNVLKIIDNAKQDIPLASVLKSPIVGINEEELTQIRLTNQRVSYYEALQEFLPEIQDRQLKAKLTQFVDRLTNWRQLARRGSLSELVWQIYRETGYYDFVAGMPGGRQRQANLRALYDRARGYEQTTFRGLFRFLRMIERMEERGEDLGAARALGEQEDVVRITTIHKSKGLEYPIVILGAMDKVFNQQDLRQRYLLHKDFGFGSRYIDPEKRIMYPTLLYYAIRQYMKRELWAEEMRVLYVALTRAKEKLVMVGSVNSFEKKQNLWLETVEQPDWTLPSATRLQMSSYMDWVGASVIRHHQAELLRGDEQAVQICDEVFNDPSAWKISLEHARDYQTVSEDKQIDLIDLRDKINQGELITDLDPELTKHVENRLSFNYQYVQATEHRAKQSVTEIKRQQEKIDDNAATDLIRPFQPQITARPTFMLKEKRLSRAEIGTAMHTVMQHISFEEDWDQSKLKQFIQQLVLKEILTHEQSEVIDLRGIEQFFHSDAYQVIKKARQIEREVPFSVMIPSNEVYPDWQGEQEDIFLQGIIDLLVETDDGWVIIDYKTDYVNPVVDQAEVNRLKDRYQTQIKLYKQAIETILKVEINQTYLYFFNRSIFIEL
ncbi:MAG: helicase-exonuclease AddAB subunit AddA [Amphibacillus sp.]|nr:helicase-exonuclease AddAB subunit AddA [Amphibacillus sp.]